MDTPDTDIVARIAPDMARDIPPCADTTAADMATERAVRLCMLAVRLRTRAAVQLTAEAARRPFNRFAFNSRYDFNNCENQPECSTSSQSFRRFRFVLFGRASRAEVRSDVPQLPNSETSAPKCFFLD